MDATGPDPTPDARLREHQPADDQPTDDRPTDDRPTDDRFSDRSGTQQQPVRRHLVAALVGTALVVVAADQSSKEWALRSLAPGAVPTPVIDGWLQFRLVFNPGAAFNLATGTTWIFTVIATCVAIFILRISRRLGSRGWALALGLLLGGAVGNLIDRLARAPGFARGHVVDFIEYTKFPFMDFPVFNIADSCIVTAAFLITLLGFRGIALDGSREPATGDTPDSGRRDA